MSLLKEEKSREEILDKITELKYESAIVECALFKKIADEEKWYVYAGR
jgi:hypothetical protein